MSAKWIRLQTDFHRHPKTAHLCRILGQPLADAYVTRTWSFVSDFCPTGHVRDIDGTTLEDACGWRGTPGELLAALVESGWLEVSETGGWDAHDWAEHQGKVAARAAKERERKRAYRERLAANCPADVPRTSHGTTTRDISPRPAQRNVTRRNVTRRNVENAATVAPLLLEPEKRAEKPPPDTRHAPLVKAMVEAFTAVMGAPPSFDGRQAKAVTSLLAKGEPSEVLRRWRQALEHRGFPTVRAPHELVAQWDHFAVPTEGSVGNFAPGAQVGGW